MYRSRLPTEPLPPDDDPRIERIVAFWNRLRLSDDAGRTSWQVLESLEREVTDCLTRRTPSDIERAESLTALAALLIAGLTEL